MKVEYTHNNSGGRDWLTSKNWKDLEAAGWEVEWWEGYDPPRGWRAVRHGLTLGQAIVEWEAITGERAADAGCSCCGHPHSFWFTGDNGESAFNFVDPYEDDYWDDDYGDDDDVLYD